MCYVININDKFLITKYLNFVIMEEVDIGKIIKDVFDKKGLTVTEFAKRINKSRENVYDIFKRKSIDTDLLQIISQVLEYDFFTHYLSINKSSNEIDRLKEENVLLKELNSLLKEKIK